MVGLINNNNNVCQSRRWRSPTSRLVPAAASHSIVLRQARLTCLKVRLSSCQSERASSSASPLIDRISIKCTVVVCNKKSHRDGCSITFISLAPITAYRILKSSNQSNLPSAVKGEQEINDPLKPILHSSIESSHRISTSQHPLRCLLRFPSRLSFYCAQYSPHRTFRYPSTPCDPQHRRLPRGYFSCQTSGGSAWL